MYLKIQKMFYFLLNVTAFCVAWLGAGFICNALCGSVIIYLLTNCHCFYTSSPLSFSISFLSLSSLYVKSLTGSLFGSMCPPLLVSLLASYQLIQDFRIQVTCPRVWCSRACTLIFSSHSAPLVVSHCPCRSVPCDRTLPCPQCCPFCFYHCNLFSGAYEIPNTFLLLWVTKYLLKKLVKWSKRLTHRIF